MSVALYLEWTPTRREKSIDILKRIPSAHHRRTLGFCYVIDIDWDLSVTALISLAIPRVDARSQGIVWEPPWSKIEAEDWLQRLYTALPPWYPGSLEPTICAVGMSIRSDVSSANKISFLSDRSGGTVQQMKMANLNRLVPFSLRWRRMRLAAIDAPSEKPKTPSKGSPSCCSTYCWTKSHALDSPTSSSPTSRKSRPKSSGDLACRKLEADAPVVWEM